MGQMQVRLARAPTLRPMMKASFALLATALFAVALPASAAGSTVTLKTGSVSFKQALADCPGALGTVSFTLSHTRIAAAPGVSDDTDTSGTTGTTVFDNGKGGTATVTTNGQNHTVSAKNVKPAANGQVACIAPD